MEIYRLSLLETLKLLKDKKLSPKELLKYIFW